MRAEAPSGTRKADTASVPSKTAAGTKPGQDSDKACLYLSDMTWWTTEDELRSLLSAGPKPVRIRFLEHPANGKSRGIALIQFEGSAAAQTAHDIMSGKYASW